MARIDSKSIAKTFKQTLTEKYYQLFVNIDYAY